jgi:glutamine synthetase
MSFGDKPTLDFDHVIKKNNNINNDSDSDTKWQDIQFIQVRYTDVPGKFLAKYYLLKDNEHFYDVCRNGIGLDGSSVKGFASIDESDLLLVPDRLTATLSPISSYKTVTVIADVHRGFGQGRLTKDPRYTSQHMEEYLAENNLFCQVGSEVECFVFDDIVFNNNNTDKEQELEVISSEQYGNGKYPIRIKGGYDAPPFQDSLLEFRFKVADILKKYYSINATNLNHEVASNGQIEINFMHDTLTKTADNVQTYKDVVRNVAKQCNKIANFMPKPIFDKKDPRNDDNGSGMHVSISLWNKSSGSKNIFYDEDDNYAELSQTGRYFIGGMLDHAPSLAAIVAPTVNSYHRMVPGFEAPVYIAWSRGNRSAVIRVPINEKKNAKSKRIEFRAPDPSANPYLAFSAIVAAGLDGIKKKIDPGNPISENIYKMSDSMRNSLAIKSLPGSLEESLEALKNDSDYLKICFNNELIDTYMDIKQEEITEAGEGTKIRQFILYHDV